VELICNIESSISYKNSEIMKRILIPTDLSTVADNAIEYALTLPKEGVQEVLLFHAGAKVGEKFKQLNREVNKLSEKFHVEIINSEKPFGVDSIKEIVRDRFIDFMIMGTSGDEGSVFKKLFGNHTSSIIDDLNCPMIAVPVSYTAKGISKIGYASDFTDVDEEMRQVIAFAKIFNAQIEVLHVTPVYPDLYDTEKMDVEKIVERIKLKSGYPEIHYVVEETFGDNKIRQGIEQFAEHYEPDLMVMFHQQREGIDKIISASSTESLITHLEVPLLVFPKFK